MAWRDWNKNCVESAIKMVQGMPRRRIVLSCQWEYGYDETNPGNP
jgi:hypothetical protein